MNKNEARRAIEASNAVRMVAYRIGTSDDAVMESIKEKLVDALIATELTGMKQFTLKSGSSEYTVILQWETANRLRCEVSLSVLDFPIEVYR